MDKFLLDLRHVKTFSHGQVYVAISRVHLATDCSVYGNDGYCAERNSRPCSVLGGVVYDELFNPPSENPPATAAPVDHPSRRQPRLADLSGQLDDASTDRRVGHRMFLSNAAPRANQARANHLPARKRKRYEALFPELLALLLYVTAIRRRSQVRGSYSRTRLDRRVSKYHIRVLGWQGSRLAANML